MVGLSHDMWQADASAGLSAVLLSLVRRWDARSIGHAPHSEYSKCEGEGGGHCAGTSGVTEYHTTKAATRPKTAHAQSAHAHRL